LIASLALHLGLAVGVTLSYFHWTVTPLVSHAPAQPPIATLVLQLEEKSPLPPAAPTIARKVVPENIVPVAPPAPLETVVAKALPLLKASTPLVVEKNPNAHLPAPSPEAVLSPSPAPHLDGTHGVVFILDISGSMYEAVSGTTRLALARQALSHEILALKNGTPFAVTLYAERAVTSGPLVAASPATREAAVRFVMRDVDCGGGTDLPAGFASACALHTGSLVLATDGDLNTSASSLSVAALNILGPKEHCPALTVIGISPRTGTGDERILQALADQQGGIYRGMQSGDGAELVTSASSATKPASATP
jgi:hypothetical protein